MSFRGLFAKAGLYADGVDIRVIRGALVTRIVNQIWVSKDGRDTRGKGTAVAPYLTITKAFTEVTATRNVVILMPGEYEEADTLTWPDVSGVHLIALAGDQWSTIVKTDGSGDEVISVAPTSSSTFEMWIEGIHLDHDTTGQDGLKLDNANMTAKLNCYLRNFGADGASSDRTIITAHGNASDAIRIYMDGNNGSIEGDVFIDIGNNGDRFHATGVKFSGGLQSSADAIVSEFKFINCWGFPENAALTGGNAAQTVLAQNCFNDAPAILDSTDLAGSHTETIVGDHTTPIVDQVWVSKDGDDTSGKGTIANPFLTITKAFTLVTAARNQVMLLPGEYEEGSGLTWPDFRGVHLIGVAGSQWSTIIKTDGTGDQVISVAPTASSTFEMWIENIHLDHDNSGQDGLKLDNASMTAKLLCYLRNFGADGSSSDKSIITSHAYASEAIRIYMDGNNGAIEGDIFIDVGNGGDRFHATGVKLAGGIESSADATVCDFHLTNCWGFPENAGLTGGASQQTLKAQNCYNDAPAIFDSTDAAGSHTNTAIVP